MLSKELKDERSVATDDDSSNVAGYKTKNPQSNKLRVLFIWV